MSPNNQPNRYYRPVPGQPKFWISPETCTYQKFRAAIRRRFKQLEAFI